jgi:hypothetical protein
MGVSDAGGVQLSTAPTVVVGAGPAATEALTAAAALVRLYEPRLTPILRFAALTNSGGPADLTAQVEQVLSEANLEAARAEGLRVGGEALVGVRILLLLDGSEPEAARQLLALVREAVAAVPLAIPARLATVVLTAGAQAGQVGFPLREWLAEPSERLAPAMVIALDRFRSDGSSLSPDRAEVAHALGYLLFTSLLPWAGEEHWLFARAVDGKPLLHTLGLGLLVIPLEELLEALAHRLAAESLPLAAEQVPTGPFLTPLGLAQRLGERGMWSECLHDVPVVLPDTDPPFQVRLQEGQARAQLGECHWRLWGERLAEFDAEWGALVSEEWVAKVRAASRKALTDRLAVIDSALDAAVGTGRGLLGRAEAVLTAADQVVGGWECSAPRFDPTVPNRNLDKHRGALAAALRAMPNGWGLGIRAALVGLCVLVLGLGLTRAALAFLGSAGTLVAGGATLLGLAAVGWRAASTYHAAKQRVLAARNDYLGAITEKYAAVLRAEGLIALRTAAERLKTHVRQRREELERLQNEFATAAERHGRAAAAFAPRRSPVVRPVVADGAGVTAIARRLWGDTDLDPVLRHLVAGTGRPRFGALAEPAGDAGEALATATLGPARDYAARAGWRERLRDFAFHLDVRAGGGEEAQRWLAEEIRALHAQAGKLLWPRVGGGNRIWQLTPPDEHVRKLTQAAHPERAELALVPGVVGTLVLREAEDADAG